MGPSTRCLRAFVCACVAAGCLAAQGNGPLLPRVAALRDLAPAPRLAALTAIVDELVFADDPQRSDAMNALRAHAANGLFYSPSATEPSMLWFQYERACRRSEVRRKGATPQALEQTLGALRERRAGALPMIGALRKGQATELYDLTSFGWHGAGEVLEAVADLAEQKGEAARDVGAELAKYLACEKPHPLQPHLEAGAGLGEAVPAATEASRFPVLWGDGYRIALARAVLATKPAGVDATHAVLHLLYSPRRADRFDAIARLRGAALGADAVTHLVAQLGDADRLVVREVIALLGSGGEAARAARERLRELANGTDKELRATAERALKQLDR